MNDANGVIMSCRREPQKWRETSEPKEIRPSLHFSGDFDGKRRKDHAKGHYVQESQNKGRGTDQGIY